MELKLNKLNESDFNSWVAESRERYAVDKLKANDLTPGEAKEIAQRDFDRTLSDGLNTKDNFIYSVVTLEGTSIGELWYCLRGASNNRIAWLCEIYLKPEFRGKGYGKHVMKLFEEDVKEKGVGKTGLHVFSFNEAAINLYKATGYFTTDLAMQKNL